MGVTGSNETNTCLIKTCAVANHKNIDALSKFTRTSFPTINSHKIKNFQSDPASPRIRNFIKLFLNSFLLGTRENQFKLRGCCHRQVRTQVVDGG